MVRVRVRTKRELFLIQVEKDATIPTYVEVHNKAAFEDGDKRRARSATSLRRGGKISKLRRLIETAARRRGVTYTSKRKVVTPPQVSHQTCPASPRASPRKAAKKTEGTSATKDVLEEEAEIEAEVKAAKEGMVVHDDDDDDAESNDETITYSFKDDRTGSSTSPKPMPTALTHIEKIAKRIFRGERAYTRVVLEAGRAEMKRDLVHILNQLVLKKLPLVLAKLRAERVQASHRGPEDVFSYNTVTHKTTISLPQDTMLVIPEDLSIQLGLRGKVYLGRRTRADDVTDVNYKNHTVYLYTDIIKNVVVGDTEAPLLRCTAVKNKSEEDMTTYDFPNPIYIPLNTNYLKEVTIYLRDSFRDPIPFDYGEVVAILGLRPIPPGLSGTLV